MEYQQITFIRQGIIFTHAENLSGLQKYHRGIGIIVIFTTATTAVGALLGEQHGIELEFNGILFQIRMFQIDDACLGMQSFASQTAVAFAHALYVQRLFHLSFQLIILVWYSFGVHPSRFLNRRHRCCGYRKPDEYAIWLAVSRVPTIRSFAISITFSCMCSCGVLPVSFFSMLSISLYFHFLFSFITQN